MPMPFAADRFLPALAARIRQAADANGQALVAIDGRSLAGKTQLALELLPHLGPDASVLTVDSYFEPLDDPRTTPPSQRRWRLRFDDLTAALQALKSGRPVRHAPYDWDLDRSHPETVIRPGIVLVEGLGALRRELRGFYDFAVWVEGRHSTRMDRIAARDGNRYLDLWVDQWLPLEEAYVTSEKPWKAADLFVAGADISIGEIGAQLTGNGR
jgi:uridine kinase